MIVFNEKYGPAAQSYNELTGRQLIKIAALIGSNGDEVVARLKALQVLLNKSVFFFA